MVVKEGEGGTGKSDSGGGLVAGVGGRAGATS